MSRLSEELYRKALDLDEGERAALAARLIESLDTELEEGVEAAWLAEVEGRMEELDSGKAQSIPWDEVRARLFDGREWNEMPLLPSAIAFRLKGGKTTSPGSPSFQAGSVQESDRAIKKLES